MNITSRIISIAISVGLLFLIFNLVRKKKLKEKYALVWLLTGISIFILALFHNLLNWITLALGIRMPVNMIFFLGILFLLLINIHFSLVISNLSEQNKKIVQELSLLKMKIQNI